MQHSGLASKVVGGLGFLAWQGSEAGADAFSEDEEEEGGEEQAAQDFGEHGGDAELGGGGRPTGRVIETSTGVGVCQVLKGAWREDP